MRATVDTIDSIKGQGRAVAALPARLWVNYSWVSPALPLRHFRGTIAKRHVFVLPGAPRRWKAGTGGKEGGRKEGREGGRTGAATACLKVN
jgi:hypothetical protein